MTTLTYNERVLDRLFTFAVETFGSFDGFYETNGNWTRENVPERAQVILLELQRKFKDRAPQTVSSVELRLNVMFGDKCHNLHSVRMAMYRNAFCSLTTIVGLEQSDTNQP